jgi:predicted secreted protein
MVATNGRAVIIEKDSTDLKDELRTKTITFNGELVDVTTDGDEGWTTTLADTFNTINVTLPLEGVLKTDTLTDMAFTGEQDTFTITVGALFTLTGTWQFQPGFQIGAPHNGERTFSGTLQSSGTITKAAVV